MYEGITELPEVALVSGTWVVNFDHFEPFLECSVVRDHHLALLQRRSPLLEMTSLSSALRRVSTAAELGTEVRQSLRGLVARLLQLEEDPVELLVVLANINHAAHGVCARKIWASMRLP